MIEVNNLTKEYMRRKVVDDLSFKVKKGSTFGFLGQNGSGKTTTMKMIVGLINPTSGNVELEGKSPQSSECRAKLGFMPESPYFYEGLTGLEFLEFCDRLFDPETSKSESEYENILSRVNLHEAGERAIRGYSKGMRQRLGLAQVLINDPDYVFLDEPLIGLDPMGRKMVKDIIHKFREEGKTVFFNSHILHDVEELCDKIGIIHRGKLLFQGAVEEFADDKHLEERFVEFITEQQHNKITE